MDAIDANQCAMYLQMMGRRRINGHAAAVDFIVDVRHIIGSLTDSGKVEVSEAYKKKFPKSEES